MCKIFSNILNRENFYVFELCTIFFLSGCSVGPDYVKPKMDLPEMSTSANEEVNKFLSDKWWSVFQNQTLDALEEIALKNNTDIKQAIATVEEACGAAGVSFADFFPSIGLNAAHGKTKAASKIPGMKSEIIDSVATASVFYEIDLWGKYRRANEAAKARLLASQAMKDTVLLTITSEVAKAYFMLCTLQAKLAIARRTLASREQSCRIYKTRFENGCSELDYLRIESEMSSVKATLLDLEANEEKVKNTLSVLIGKNISDTILSIADSTTSKLDAPSVIPNGLPSDLLERRPDIAQAEAQLIAANADIGQAIAAHFPSFSLTGALGFESSSLGLLFNGSNEVYNIKSAISLPVFTAGKLSSLSDMAKAKYKRMLAIYEKAVQTAFRETFDALIVNRKSKEIVDVRSRQLKVLTRSYDIARTQNASGLIGLIDLLDVERGLLAVEMELIGALQNQLNAVVDLCKALGGGWNTSKLTK
jgi:multidrug efflux system outer membrane protein